MTILLIHDRPEAVRPEQREKARADGVVNYLLVVKDALAARGECVISVAVGSDLPEDGSIAQGWLTQSSNGVRRNPAQEDAIERLVETTNPSVVHFHGIHFNMRPRFLKRLNRHWPSVVTLHDVGQFCPKATRLLRDNSICTAQRGLNCIMSGCFRPWDRDAPLKEIVNLAMAPTRRDALNSMRRIICPSAYIAGLADQHGCDRDRLRVVPNFARFEPVCTPPPRQGRILFAGRLDEHKGFDLLIDALSGMTDASWHLTAIGNGPLRDLARVRLGKRLALHDAVPPGVLQNMLQKSDIIALPYRMPEAFGMIGAEALSQRRMVVGFPAGGAAMWMRPEFGARPVAQGDVAALRVAMLDALADPDIQPGTPFPFTLNNHLEMLLSVYGEARADHVKR